MVDQDLKPFSDWDGWTPPDSSNMHEKFTNIDQLSDIPTIGCEQYTADLMNALAEADRPRRKKRKPPRSLSTAALVAGPTSRRRRLLKISVGGKRKKKKNHQK